MTKSRESILKRKKKQKYNLQCDVLPLVGHNSKTFPKALPAGESSAQMYVWDSVWGTSHSNHHRN